MLSALADREKHTGVKVSAIDRKIARTRQSSKGQTFESRPMAAHNNQNHEKQCTASLSVLNAKITPPHASSELIQHLAPEQQQKEVFVSCASALFIFVCAQV